MGAQRPKEILREALELESKGDKREASRKFSALSVFLRRREKSAEALAMINRAIGLSPNSARLYVQKALCHLALGMDEEAKAAVEVFTQQTLARNKVGEFAPYLERHLEGYPSLRQVFYEEVLKLERTGAAMFLGLARALRVQRYLDKAQKVLLGALKTRDLRDEVIVELTEVLKGKRAKKELEYLKRFCAGKLSEDELLSLLGSKSKEAQSESKSQRADSDSKSHIRDTNTSHRSDTLTDERTLKSLIEELEGNLGGGPENLDTVTPLINEFKMRSSKVIEGDPKAQMDMAVAFMEMGLNSDAKQYLDQITDTDTYYLEARCLRGEIDYLEGSYLAALELFQDVLRMEKLPAPVSCLGRYMLAQIYSRLGDYVRAYEFAESLAKDEPSYRHLSSLRSFIESKLQNITKDRSQKD